MVPLVRQALLFGSLMGAYGIGAVFLILNYLPAAFGVLIPIGALVIPIAFQWPHWFDRGAERSWTRRPCCVDSPFSYARRALAGSSPC